MSKAATLAGFATSIIPPNDLIVGIVTATSLSVGNQTVSSLGVGISTEGGSVGTGATVLDFRGAGISTVTVSSGIATVNITGGGGGGASVTTSDTAPVSPSDGDLWYDSVGGRMYVYYDDGDTSQWVDAAPQGGGNAFSAKIEVGNTKAEVTDTGSDGAFAVTTEGTERARVDSSGRLLVGTTSSSTSGQIHVRGPMTPIGGGITLEANLTASFIGANDPLGRISFGAICTGSTPAASLDSARIEAVADGTWGSNSDVPSRLVFSTTADGASSPTERMRIKQNGQTCINTTGLRGNDGGFTFDVDGRLFQSHENGSVTGTIYHEFAYNGNPIGSINQNGTTGVSYNTSSDYRLKENIVPLTGAADRLKQIPVHRFNFIADPDTTVDGFLAHEAQSIVPECVTGTKDEVDAEGNPVYQGIDQSKLVPLITAALQEALHQIETQSGVITALNARITALEGGN